MIGAAGGRDELPDELERQGLVVARVSCYETVPAELVDAQRAALAEADVVVIGAPSAWRVARSSVRATAWVVVPGPTTAAAVRAEHPRLIERWGPELGEVLAGLGAGGPESAGA